MKEKSIKDKKKCFSYFDIQVGTGCVLNEGIKQAKKNSKIDKNCCWQYSIEGCTLIQHNLQLLIKKIYLDF